MPANEIKFFECNVSKETAKLIAKIASPAQIAQNMKLQTDLAYATAQQRIDSAKRECELRRKCANSTNNLPPLSAPNTCVSDGPADGNDNKSSAEGPFAARNG